MSYDLTTTAGLEQLLADLRAEPWRLMLPEANEDPIRQKALDALFDRYRTHAPVMLPCRGYVAGWEELCRKVAGEVIWATGCTYTDGIAAAVQVISLLATGDAHSVMQSENKRPGILRRIWLAFFPRRTPLPRIYELSKIWTVEQQQAWLEQKGFVEVGPGHGQAMIARAKAGIPQGPGLCSCGCRIVDGRCEYCGKQGAIRAESFLCRDCGAQWPWAGFSEPSPLEGGCLGVAVENPVQSEPIKVKLAPEV